VLTKITEHIYWMPPGPPDRPSVCAVVGKRYTLLLDAGSSAAHTAQFTRELFAESGTHPSAVVYTHADWDHVLGGAEVDGLVIAHALTAKRLDKLAARDWSDEGLDRLVALGLASHQHVANVKTELPSPRRVRVAPADIVFADGIEIDTGDVRVHVRHVGGDHSADSCVMFVDPDRVLFLGDCLYASGDGVLTPESAFRLRETVLSFDAAHYVDGHHESVSSRSEMETLFEKMRLAESAVREGSELAGADEDTAYFFQAFTVGSQHRTTGSRS
jgi:glyoxylase-like metal-dependent hydrolase (beta-lactamase superfamily II)